LRRNDSGDSVRRLQLLLNSILTPPPHLTLDGAFGLGTEAAVKRLQRGQKLEPDGVVGPRTWEVLNQQGKLQNRTVKRYTTDAPWLEIAMLEYGVHEDSKPGKETSRIVEYHQYSDYPLSDYTIEGHRWPNL
jgi:peptidoglycan hydrolase-like protein with peptidoglycan-binding domain